MDNKKAFMKHKRNRRRGFIYKGFQREEILDDLIEEREEAACKDIVPKMHEFDKLLKK